MTEAAPTSRKFGESFRSAVVWNALDMGVGQVMTLVIFLILTTKLDPVVFGLYALALVFIDFFNLEGRYSVIDTLLQKQRFDETSLSTAFWVMIGINATVGVALFFGAPIIAEQFNEPGFTDVLRALLLSLVILPFVYGPTAALSKERDFKFLSIRASVSKILGGLAALIIVFGPQPAWALVVQRLTSNLVEAVFLVSQTKLYPKFKFDGKWAREFIVEVGRVVSAQTMVKWLLRMVDVFIAFLLGAVMVGIWRVAERILQVVFAALATPMSALWVITLSDENTRVEDRKRFFLDLTQLATMVLVPAFVGLALVSQDFVDAFIDPRYAKVGTVLSILCWFCALAPFYYFRGGALVALKKSRTLISLAAMDIIVLSLAMLAIAWATGGVKFLGLNLEGLQLFGIETFPLEGAIFSLGFVYVVSTVVMVPIILKATGAEFWDLWRQILPAFVATAIMAAMIVAVDHLWPGSTAWGELAGKVAIGAMTYGLYIFLLHRDWVTDAYRLVMDTRGG